jgi:hypothetical protein
MKENRQQLCEFENIVEGAVIWESESVIKVCWFLVFLLRFLKKLSLTSIFRYSDTFDYADILCSVLTAKDFNILNYEKKIKETEAHLSPQ